MKTFDFEGKQILLPDPPEGWFLAGISNHIERIDWEAIYGEVRRESLLSTSRLSTFSFTGHPEYAFSPGEEVVYDLEKIFQRGDMEGQSFYEYLVASMEAGLAATGMMPTKYRNAKGSLSCGCGMTYIPWGRTYIENGHSWLGPKVYEGSIEVCYATLESKEVYDDFLYDNPHGSLISKVVSTDNTLVVKEDF